MTRRWRGIAESGGSRATFDSSATMNPTRFVGNQQNLSETAINLQKRKEVTRYGPA